MITLSLAKTGHAAILRTIQKNCWLETLPNQQYNITYEAVVKKSATLLEKENIASVVNKIKDAQSRTWIAQEHNTIVGFIGVEKKDTKRIIDGLFITPPHQRKGIGTLLMKKAFEWLGPGPISLEVIAYNQQAIRFYESLGFEQEGVTTHDPLRIGEIVIPKIGMLKH